VLNTALQLGGAIGVALIGVIFFGLVSTEGFVGSLDTALWFEIGVYLVSALAMLMLPKGAAVSHGEATLEPAAAES
jgi:hypothetical protein